MTEDQYRASLAKLAEDWGGVHVDASMPGYIRADNDPTTGLLIGMRAALFAEIINRALRDASPAPKRGE